MMERRVGSLPAQLLEVLVNRHWAWIWAAGVAVLVMVIVRVVAWWLM